MSKINFNKASTIVWLLTIVCVILLSGGLVLYFVRFHGSLAKEQAVFGMFGDYINPFLTLVNTVILTYISMRANQIAHSFSQVQLQPLLFLSLQKSKLVKGQEDWVLNNGYDAPAINILIRFKIQREGSLYTNWVHGFSLSRDCKKKLAWIRWPDEIQILWTDLANQRHFRIVHRDWVGKLESDISKENYDLELKNAITGSLNTNDIISTEFKRYFYGASSMELNQDNYMLFLKQLNLIVIEAN